MYADWVKSYKNIAEVKRPIPLKTIIGKIPNLVPEWMEEISDESGVPTIKNNGIWTNTTLNIPELIATYLKVWLEDAVPAELTQAIEDSKGQYTPEKQLEAISQVYNGLVSNRITELNNMLSSIKQQEPAEAETTNN